MYIYALNTFAVSLNAYNFLYYLLDTNTKSLIPLLLYVFLFLFLTEQSKTGTFPNLKAPSPFIMLEVQRYNKVQNLCKAQAEENTS